ECKDHSRRKGPDAVEAFAKRMENLGANLRLMVSRKGFTPQALQLAKHEHIGCLSLLPGDNNQVGFSVGETWYGIISRWEDIHRSFDVAGTQPEIRGFDASTVRYNDKPAINWFLREMYTTYSDVDHEGDWSLMVEFDGVRDIEVEGKIYPVPRMYCNAKRIYK